MKKIFALLLAMLLLASLSVTAFAEEEPIDIESYYDGTWVEFVDDGFEIYIPSDWLELELEQEFIDEYGIYYAVASPDGECTFQVAWAPIDEELDTPALHAELASAYPEAEIIELNGFDAVCFADAEAETLSFAVLDQVDPGIYYFIFTPVTDEDLVALATLMMLSIS